MTRDVEGTDGNAYYTDNSSSEDVFALFLGIWREVVALIPCVDYSPLSLSESMHSHACL